MTRCALLHHGVVGRLMINDRFAVELWRRVVDRAKESTQQTTHTTTKTASCQTDKYLDKRQFLTDRLLDGAWRRAPPAICMI
jgi:hypothetical protein